MFTIFMIVLTFFLVVSFIIRPLLMKSINRPSIIDTSLDILNLKKEVVYRQIKEAEMEFEMGDLSKRDFERTRNTLKQEASRIIAEIQRRSGK